MYVMPEISGVAIEIQWRSGAAARCKDRNTWHSGAAADVSEGCGVSRRKLWCTGELAYTLALQDVRQVSTPKPGNPLFRYLLTLKALINAT